MFAFFLILISLYLVIKLKRLKVLAILPLLFAFHSQKGEFIDTPKAKIYMPQMYINQDLKWDKEYLKTLNDAWAAASEDMYKAQQQGGANANQQQDNSQANANNQQTSENVTDVDFEEVK